MSNLKLIVIAGLVAIFLAPVAVARDSGLETLFTTPQERKLINANRYRSEEARPEKKPMADESVAAQVREIVMEEITAAFRISGISITRDGSRTAWINGQVHENGATLEQGVKVRINNKSLKTVTLTAPDGKQYTGAIGDTVNISFQQPVEQP